VRRWALAALLLASGEATAAADELDALDDLVRLAEMEHAVFVAAGGGWLEGAIATLDVRWQRPTLPSGWEVLPNAIGVGLWLGDEGDAAVPLSLGWRVALGPFEGPVLLADALWLAVPGALGAELGAGYEHRLSNRWSVVGEARGVWIESAGVGARGVVEVRMYLGDFTFVEE
jgi:hypothetical protein